MTDAGYFFEVVSYCYGLLSSLYDYKPFVWGMGFMIVMSLSLVIVKLVRKIW